MSRTQTGSVEVTDGVSVQDFVPHIVIDFRFVDVEYELRAPGKYLGILERELPRLQDELQDEERKRVRRELQDRGLMANDPEVDFALQELYDLVNHVLSRFFRNPWVPLPFCHLALGARKPPPATYPQELKTLGDHLRKRRLDLGLLQREVAERLGVHKATIYNWESNRKSPQLRFLPGIIEFLGYVPHGSPSSTLDERIVDRRRALGLTQKELAHRLGVDPSTLRRWETARGQPSRKHRIGFGALLADETNSGTPKT